MTEEKQCWPAHHNHRAGSQFAILAVLSNLAKSFCFAFFPDASISQVQ